MIYVARLSYHELVNVWPLSGDIREYRKRTKSEIYDVLMKYINDFKEKSLLDFIKPYALFPFSQDNLRELADEHAAESLYVGTVWHENLGEDVIRLPVRQKLKFTNMTASTIVLFLGAAPRTQSGAPRIAEIFITLGE